MVKAVQRAAEICEVTAPRLTKHLRARALSSDARAGSWSRNKARRAQREFVRAKWRQLLLGVTVMLLTVMIGFALMPTAFSRGLFLGAGLAATVGAFAYLILQVTGTAPAIMGGQGEQWTGSELRPLQRCGWRVVHHVALRSWDIDHVLIGPGGAFAIETKWSAQPWVLAPAESRVQRAASQAAGNARDLRLWTHFRKAGIDVKPVVMLWGPAAGPDELEGPMDVQGTLVMRGSQAGTWRAGLVSGVLSSEQVEAGWLALDEHVRRRDEHDQEDVLLSVEQIFSRTVSTLIAGGAGVVLAASALRTVGSLWAWVPLCAAAALLAQPLRRYAITRLPALAWRSGVIGTGALAGLAGALSLPF